MISLETTPPALATEPQHPNARRLRLLAAIALLLGAVLQLAGLASSHPEVSPGRVAYLAASAADPLRTQVSALLLHYAAVAMGLGLLVAPVLVRGRRGAVLTLLGSVLATVSLVNLSGAIFVDWVHLQLALDLPLEQGAALSDRMYDHPLLQAGFGLAPLIAVGLVLAVVGLARGRVVGWWTVPAVVVGYAGMLFLPYSTPVLPALGSLPMLAVLARIAWAASRHP